MEKTNYSIEYINSHKVAIHVRTSVEVKKCDELLGWNHSYYYFNFRDDFNCISNSVINGFIDTYKRDGFEIIKASDFIKYQNSLKNENMNNSPIRYYKLIKDVKSIKSGEYKVGMIYSFPKTYQMMPEHWEEVKEIDYLNQENKKLKIIGTDLNGNTYFSDGFFLLKNWYIKFIIEVNNNEYNHDILVSWFRKKTNCNDSIFMSFSDNYYLGYSKTTNNLTIRNDTTFFDASGEITFEQFLKYILDMETDKTNATVKTEITVMKDNQTSEIIGYKLKYPEYKEAINKILGFCFDARLFELDGKSYPDTFSKLTKAGVLDIWFETIYIPIFKIGQWVYWCGNNPTFGRIIGKDADNKHCYVLDNTLNNNTVYNSCSYKNLRYPTENEIKLHLIHLFESKGYKGNKIKYIAGLNLGKISDNSIPKNDFTYYYNFRDDEFVILWNHNKTTYTIYLKGEWAEIVKDEYISFKFGEVDFKLYKGNDYAVTNFGNIPMLEIKNAINYIENPPSLGGHALTIHTKLGYSSFSSIDRNVEGIILGFGCKSGKLKELKDIYFNYCQLNNIDYGKC